MSSEESPALRPFETTLSPAAEAITARRRPSCSFAFASSPFPCLPNFATFSLSCIAEAAA